MESLRVRLADGTSLPGRVVARDRDADLALLKVDAGAALPVMPLGTASDLMVGETVIAIGNAYGYEHTVSVGVVSAVGRDVALNKEVSYKALIQTDASINPGNSGGPLLNINGELIGVNVAIRAGAQGIGFAIPVDAVIKAAAGMMDGNATGTGLGLIVHDDVHTDGDNGAWQRNVVVDRVDAGSAAAKAGLQRGDMVMRAGDVVVNSSLALERGFLEHIAGDHIALVVKRNGVEQKADVVLLVGAGPLRRRRLFRRLPLSSDDLIWRKLGVRLRAVGAQTCGARNPQLHGGLTVIGDAARRPRVQGWHPARRCAGRPASVGNAHAGQCALRSQQCRPGHVQSGAVLRPSRRSGPSRHGSNRRLILSRQPSFLLAARRQSAPPVVRPNATSNSLSSGTSIAVMAKPKATTITRNDGNGSADSCDPGRATTMFITA